MINSGGIGQSTPFSLIEQRSGNTSKFEYNKILSLV
jgi:hypothetical protein